MKKNKQQPIDVSDEEQIITDEQALSEIKEDLHMAEEKKGLAPKKPLYIRTLNVFTEPAKRRYDKHYREKKHHLVIDILLALIVVLLFIANGIFLHQKNRSFTFDFFKGQQKLPTEIFEIKSSVNQIGSPAVSPGDEIEYVISLKNISTESVENLNIKAEIISSAVDFETVQSKGFLANQKISWTRNEVESLTNIKPSETREVDFVFKIKKYIPVANPTVTINLNLSGLVNGQVVNVEENMAPVKVSSDLTVDAQYKYFTEEGDQLGFGAWPIAVGEETTLRLFLSLTNNLNAMKNVTVRATLPPGVNWGGHEIVNSGKLPAYDEASRTVTWQIPEVRTSKNLLAHFEVYFTPETNSITLLKNITVAGDDTFTGERVERFFTELVIK